MLDPPIQPLENRSSTTLVLSSLLASFLPITRATDMVMCLGGGKKYTKTGHSPKYVDGVSQVRAQAIGPGLCRIAYMNFLERRKGEVQHSPTPIRPGDADEGTAIPSGIMRQNSG